jgi:F0F1-type ATP synthase assembly protein I
MEIVLGLVLPCYVGSLADKRWGTGSALLIAGFCLGLVHGVRVVMRAYKQALREQELEDQQAREARKKYYDRK